MLLETGKIGEVYNIGSGKAVKVSEILEKLIKMSKVPVSVEIDSEKFRPVDVPLVVCDNHKIRKDTGWKAEISIDDTLREVLRYWRNINN